MVAPENIAAQIRGYLRNAVVPVLPADIKALAFEVTSWHITVHMYQFQALADHSDSDLEMKIEHLATELPSRPGEPWQVTPAYHRRERGNMRDIEGEVVYAV